MSSNATLVVFNLRLINAKGVLLSPYIIRNLQLQNYRANVLVAVNILLKSNICA